MEILLKGILAGIIFWFIQKSMKENAIKGKLVVGQWMLWIGMIPVFGSLLVIYAYIDSQPHEKSEFGPALMLFALCVSLAAPLLLEWKYTYGRYNNYRILYRTPWSGYKKYHWTQIVKITHNDNLHWYVFHCIDGNKMRFSDYLTGVNELLAFTHNKNIAFEEK